ncbi:MAG TPA: hypothetical protein VHV26_04435 [Rhizomicrobium sp.]|jgi:hypothetical protein|nr:hypothetical protein [Rhizomicrobium sp.]
MKDLLLLLFSLTGGFAVSGIVSNLYCLLVPKKRRKPLLHCGVMILAGPNVMFENATTSFREKKCSRLAYGFAVCIIGYWAFALGLLAIAIGMKL